MGRDKALLELGGETLVARALRTMGEVCDEVAIAGGAQELRRFGRVIPDRVADSGPLAGIVAALDWTSTEWNVFLAVDVPFVPREAWVRLIAAAVSSEAICTMARVAGEPQPLCAVYRRSAAERLCHELETGRLKVLHAVQAAGAVEYVDFVNISWFRNFNTPMEFESAALP